MEKKNDEMKSFMEVMGLEDFSSTMAIIMFGAVVTLPLFLACTIAEWLSRLY